MLQLTRLLGAAALSAAALASLTAAPPAAATAEGTVTAATPLSPPPVRHEDRAHHLTVTVKNAGGKADGRYELYCRPRGGSHPDPAAACAAVERGTQAGQDVFAPVAQGTFCTMQHGGPATAHVTGTWAGRPVNASYDRRDGCQIARWDRLVPLLPDLRSAGAS
ncbi:SSI family serine proteinase inhibitor [Streptomyces ziwulingensis]|uniref:Subtilisin inhibitor domain-containing protein n=1 Tax=Streptomyces ziwulingensis TaxID=1045501 RepID=A0ABP9BGY9_9ACTN